VLRRTARCKAASASAPAWSPGSGSWSSKRRASSSACSRISLTLRGIATTSEIFDRSDDHVHVVVRAWPDSDRHAVGVEDVLVSVPVLTGALGDDRFHVMTPR